MTHKIQTHRFNRIRYKVYVDTLKGATDIGKHPERTLLIRTDKVSERQLLGTAVHEALHACNWDASEKKVDRTAKDLSRFLWRLGYRRK